MTTEHTPAPWVQEGFFASDEYGDFPGIIGGNGDTVCYVASFDEQPDLNLIAAAPDLLAALIALRHEFEQVVAVPDAFTAFNQATTAIAKARGENPGVETK